MKQSQIRKTYDKEASQWKKLIMQGDHFYKTNQFFFKLLKKNRKNTILDMGCGNGLQSVEFVKKGFKVLGLDFSQKMIQEAKRNKMPNLEFIHDDINKFKPKKKFGGIWACCSLHNMNFDILKKSLISLNNLLEPKGILSIKMRHGSFQGIIERNGIKRYYRYSGPKEIKKLLKNTNLKWVTTKYSKRFTIPFFTISFEKA